MCYRVTVCGDDREIAKAAIYGNGSETDGNMATYRLQSLHTEQVFSEKHMFPQTFFHLASFLPPFIAIILVLDVSLINLTICCYAC